MTKQTTKTTETKRAISAKWATAGASTEERIARAEARLAEKRTKD